MNPTHTFSKLLLASAVVVFPAQAAVVIPTSFGAGADTNIRGGSAAQQLETQGSTTSVQATVPGSTVRAIYLKFDLSNVTPSTLLNATSAQLDWEGAFSGPIGTLGLTVFGLNDAADGDGWVESTMNATNAPGLSSTSTLALNSAQVTNLGTFTSDQGTNAQTSGLETFSSAALLTFLGTNTDGLVTLIITQQSTASNNFSMRSKESTGLAPTLTIIPEPSTALLGGLGLLILLRRRRP